MPNCILNIDDISISLTKMPIGCCCGENIMNHVMHAGDIE